MATKKQHWLLTKVVLGPRTVVLYPHSLSALGYTVGHGKLNSGWLQVARTFHVDLELGSDKRFGSELREMPLVTLQVVSLGSGENAR